MGCTSYRASYLAPDDSARIESVTQVFRVLELKKLRQEPMLARVSAHRHYRIAGSNDARWPRPLAQKCGNFWRKEHHDLVRDTSRRQINTCDI